MSKYTMVAIALAFAAATASAGCGGDGSALTRAEFIEKADAICQRAKDQAIDALEDIGVDPAHELSASQAQELEEVISPLIAAQYREITELDLPDEEPERKQVKEIVRAFEGAVAEGAQGPGGVVEPEVEALIEEASAFGFRVCGGQ